MRRLLPLLLLLAFTLSTAHAAPELRLSASTTTTEFLAGDRLTIDCHLFNDGSTPAEGLIVVTAPAGFTPLGPTGARGTIAAGGHLDLYASYQVGSVTPGLYTFVVSGGGQARTIVVRVGPVVAPPAQFLAPRLWLPVFRG